MTGGPCAVCQLPAKKCCSGCRLVYYCGRDHQKQHWRCHKATCQTKPYKIGNSTTLGRFLEATVDLQPGDIVLKEQPLVVGPKGVSLPICLGCHKLMKDNSNTCRGCNWPICGAKCESSANHVEECKIMSERGYRASISNLNKIEAAYCCITPLRCLLMKTTDNTKWKTIMNLESHLEERRNTPIYKILKNNVVGFIRHVLKMADFDDDAILTVCGILDTNTFELRRSDGEVKVRGVYPRAAMMSHDCMPNTKHVFDDEDWTMTVLATVPIKKGTMITTTYTQTLWETMSRRAHLKVAKCFDCVCRRCADPTEMGTYLGSTNCPQCKEDGKLVSGDPLNAEADWKCGRCSHVVSGQQVSLRNEALRREVAALEKTPAAFERFLETHSDSLHATNKHAVEIKYALAQTYGNRGGLTLEELPDVQLQRKVAICEELLQVSSILDPGASRLTGLLLLELQDARVVQARRAFRAGKITETAKQALLQEAMELLQRTTKILQNEPGMLVKLEQKMLLLQNEIRKK